MFLVLRSLLLLIPKHYFSDLILEAVGLDGRLHHLPAQLSGGEQQRVCIARAVIKQPKIILADEPTGNLDAANEEMVLDIFRQLHAQWHTLIVVTHDARVGRMADRLVTLEQGHAVQAESNEHEPHQRVALPMLIPEPEGRPIVLCEEMARSNAGIWHMISSGRIIRVTPFGPPLVSGEEHTRTWRLLCT